MDGHIINKKIASKSRRIMAVSAPFFAVAAWILFFFRTSAGLTTAASFFTIGLFFFLFGLVPILNPEKYSAIKSLLKNASYDEVIYSIEKDFIEAPDDHLLAFGSHDRLIYLQKNWIVIENWMSIRIIPVDELLWVYKFIEKVKFHGIITYRLIPYVVFKSIRKAKRYKGDDCHIDALLKAISLAYPWVAVGYSENLAVLWKYKREVLAERVSAKRTAASRPV
jgi:hypothetical protein